MADRTLTVRITGDTAGLSRAVKKAQADTAGFDQSLKKLDDAVGKSNRNFTAFRNTVQLVKFPAMITGVGLAAQGISALGAAAVAAGASLAPLAGTLAAYPALLSAVGQGMGTVKLATQGLSEALAGDKEAFNRLTGEGQQFVRLIQRLRPEFDAIANRAQRGLLPGVEDGVRKASRALPVLANVVSGTSRAIGTLASRAGALVGSRGFLNDLEVQGRRNQTTITRLGGAALSMGNALRHVVIAAGPLVSWMTRGAAEMAKFVSQEAHAARQSGQLAGFFDQTRIALSRIGRIGADVAVALFNIAKAGKPLGDDLLKSLVRNADTFREWTESAKGRNAIAEWFEQARTPIYELAKLLRDATQAFFRLGRGDLAGPLIKQIRTEMLPAIEEVVGSTTKAFGPPLITAITNVVRVFGQLAGTSGPLTQFVKIVGSVAGGIASLLESSPGLRGVVTTMLGFAGVAKALSFAGAITGVTRLVGGMVGLGRAARIAAGGTVALNAAERAGTITRAQAVAGLVAQRVAMAATAVATRAMAIAQRILNVAMRANPIGLVITALTLIGVGLVAAYKKSETFRNIVDGAFRAVTKAASAMGRGIVAAFNFIKRLPGQVADTFGNVVSAIGRFVGRAASAATRIGRGIVSGVVDFVRRLPGRVKDFFGDVVSAIGRFVGRAASGAGRVGRGIVNGVIDFVKRLPGRAWDVFVDTIRKIGQFERRAINAAVDLGKGFVRSVIKGLGNLGHMILDKIKDAFGFVKDKAGDLIGSVGDLFGDGIGKKIGEGVGKKAQGAVGGAAIPGGKGAKGLMGANPALGGFVKIANSMGLGVSSGLRPGAITSSGNTSYHASGEAVDIAGSPGQMLKFARTMKARFGRRLAELIHTPMGAGISNGRSHVFTGQVAKDHYDHVHVALDLGRSGPGIGDGKGKLGPLGMVADSASKAGINPAVLYGVWGAESGFSMGPGPTSPAGAQGPFQFMPATARSMGVNPTNFRSAVYGAGRYLGQYKSRGIDGMLLAYNAGPAGRMNPESSQYIKNVRGYMGKWASVAPKGGGGGGGGGTDGTSAPKRGPAMGREEDQMVAGVPGGRVRGVPGIDPKKPIAVGTGKFGPVTIGSAQHLELVQAESDEMMSRAEGTDGLEDDRAALKYKLTGLRARLKKIRRDLKKKIRNPATRGRLLAEAAQLRRDIRETMAALRALGVTAADQAAEADAIEASLTADLQDDLRVAQTDLTRREADYAKAKRSGNKARIIETGQALQGARQNVQSAREAVQTVTDQAAQEAAAAPMAALEERLSLVDLQERAGDLTADQATAQRIHLRQQALAGYFGQLSERDRLQVRGDLRENTQALQDLQQAMADYTNALKTLSDEVALSNRISQSVQSTDSFQLKKVLVDIFSGQIGGYGLVGRSFTPGTGVEHAY